MSRIVLGMVLTAVVGIGLLGVRKWSDPGCPVQRISRRLGIKPQHLASEHATVWEVDEKQMDLRVVPFLNSMPGCEVQQVTGASVYHVILPDRARGSHECRPSAIQQDREPDPGEGD